MYKIQFKAKIINIGNSLGIIVPNYIIKMMDLKLGNEIHLTTIKGDTYEMDKKKIKDEKKLYGLE